MTDMKRILDAKGYSFFFISPDATVADAIRQLDKKRVGALLVMDGERMEGIFTERDVVKLLSRAGAAALDRKVQDVMTTSIFHVGLKTSVDEVMGVMSEKGIRHVPVMDGKMVVGVVSIRDVVAEVVVDREITIKGLENYIVGTDFRS
jgi:CBS domain-containing protein